MKRMFIRSLKCAAFAAVLGFLSPFEISGQTKPRTLVAVWAHPDDEGPVGPVLARYAREGVQIHMIFATDGAQGGAKTSIPRGPELAKVRAEEVRCSAQALGVNPPILLGFPDSGLGNFVADPSLLFRLTERIHGELQRLQPDALITWGLDGGMGHPDHRLVSNIVTQLVRAGAPGVPERLFYSYIPPEGFAAVNPGRGTPPFVVPQAKYLTTRISFSPADLDAARRSMACHKSQYSSDTVQKVIEQMRALGELAFSPFSPTASKADMFR
jgi:LmbE family N-acetylglucosaminyl deacetylase